jgi:hypothetical protein
VDLRVFVHQFIKIHTKTGVASDAVFANGMELPDTIEELLGFKPERAWPCGPRWDRVLLPDSVITSFIAAVKGKTFGSDAAMLVSRYGNTDYADHPLQKLEFFPCGTKLVSYCPGPFEQGWRSDASVAGPFRLTEIDEDDNYWIELQYGCKTTFVLKGAFINFEGAPAGEGSR